MRGDEGTNPFVFLMGCPRSGTTLLERLVGAHPRMAIAARSAGRLLGNREGVTAEGFVTPELADNGPILKFMSREEFAECVNRLLKSGQPVSYAGLISHVFDRYAEAHDKPLVGAKAGMTGHKPGISLRQIPVLHSLWPRAKFVHIIRDGRDVCLSVLSWRKASSLAERFSTWSEDPVTTAALWWEWQVRLGREDGTALGPELYYEIRYEALVARPEAECKTLCVFLGVPYDDAMLRFHEGREIDDPTLNAKHAWRPITSGLRDWRRDMSREEVDRFEAAAGSLLDRLDYPPGTRDPSSSALERAVRFRCLFEGRPLPEEW